MPSAISWMLVPDSRFVIIEELLRALRRECNERAGRYRESSGQSSVAKCAEANLALACREECRPQAEEVAEHIVMIAGHFEAPGMARPRLPVEAVVHRYDVAIVGDTQVELFACHGRPDPALLAAVGVREHLAAVEAESAVRRAHPRRARASLPPRRRDRRNRTRAASNPRAPCLCRRSPEPGARSGRARVRSHRARRSSTGYRTG